MPVIGPDKVFRAASPRCRLAPDPVTGCRFVVDVLTKAVADTCMTQYFQLAASHYAGMVVSNDDGGVRRGHDFHMVPRTKRQKENSHHNNDRARRSFSAHRLIVSPRQLAIRRCTTTGLTIAHQANQMRRQPMVFVPASPYTTI